MGEQREPTRVFIVWDFELATIRPTLEELAKHPPDGFEVYVPGITKDVPQGRIFEDRVRKRLDESDRVIVLTDLPNANVGYELGYALGRGKPTILATVRRELPAWVNDAGLFGGWFIASADGLKKLRRLVTANLEGEDAGRQIEARLVDRTGDATLFLCASDGPAEVYDAVRERAVPAWETIGDQWPTWHQLPERLGRVGRVVWTISPVHEGDDRRDGLQNAVAAAVAGFATATDRDLYVLRDSTACPRSIVDVKVGEIVVEGLDAYEEKLKGLVVPTGSAVVAADPIAAYRRWLRSKHSFFVPFFESTERDLDDACVTLKVSAADPERGHRELEGKERLALARSMTLRELLRLSPGAEPDVTGHWAVLGEPGSGKSTACRRLCRELAKKDDVPVPLLLNLSAWVRAGRSGDPFDYTEDLACTEEPEPCRGLATALRERSEEEGQVWLLLDGLDELTTEERARFGERLPRLIDDLPHCRFLVTSRPTDFHAPAKELREAELQPLNRSDQDDLLTRWIGPDLAHGVRAELDLRPRLAELAPNPLMLTFIAKLHEDAQGEDGSRPMPGNRGELYERAVRLLLERGREKDGQPVRSPEAAMRVLPGLALRLLLTNRDAWDHAELYDELVELLAERPALERHLAFAQWPPEAFLDDLRRIAGLLGDLDGPGTPWRFLHRSLGEFLAAQALAGQEDWGEVDPIALLKEDEARWGETFALLTGRLGPDDPRRKGLLDKLVASDSELALRTLPQVEGLAPSEAIDFLKRVEGWDGDDLLRVVRGLLLEGHGHDEVRATVLADVGDSLDTHNLAWRYYALETCSIAVDREDFFRACGRPIDGAIPQLDFVSIPAGTFVMGAPENEEGRGLFDETPHTVTVGSFELARVPVTQSQYALFDRRRRAKKADHPVVEVSWWEAWLFTRWLGVRLPTEAEWEYACRARITTRFSSGDTEADLARVGWYRDNSGGKLHAVGELDANKFGLHDMHGNVWEWCQDRWADDDADAQAAHPGAYDPVSPGSRDRVSRGGSFRLVARDARSASRDRSVPGDRGDSLGFRPARTSP